MRCSVVRHRVLGLGLWTLLYALGGCGSGEKIPELFPVTGKVTYQGKAVPRATVVFVPEVQAKRNPKEAAPAVGRIAGETDDDGNYVLAWNEKADGAPEGKYKVVITAVEPFGPEDDDEKKRANLIPDKYGSPATSGLSAVVKDDDNVSNFNLE
jgi:hypothetical protein